MTNEKIIREQLRELYQKKYPASIIRDEFTGPGLSTRNDLFLVDDSMIISFEIKSNGDTLKRLRKQVLEYKTYSSIVIIAVDEKHLDKINKQYSDLFEENVLLYIMRENKLEKVIDNGQTISADYPLLFNLLWSDELLLFRNNFKGRSKIDKSINSSKKMIQSIYTDDEIHKISKYLFTKRFKNKYWKYRKYTPVLEDEDIIELISNHQQKFTQYLKEIK